MATTILFQTAQGGQSITTGAGDVQLTSLDISNNQNIRITFGAGSNGLTFTVRISSAASGQNSDVALVLDTVALAANAMSSRVYPSPVARILRVNVRITSGTMPSAAKCIIMGN